MSATGVALRRDRAQRPWIAVIGGRATALAKARKAGLSIMWLHAPGSVNPVGLALADETHLVDYQDLGVLLPLLRCAHERLTLRRVVALTEAGLLPAAHAVTDLGLEGNGLPMVRLLSDKLAMRKHLASAGVSPVRARLGRGEADLREFVREVGPTVVKPRAACGSLGVRSAAALPDVPATWAWLAEFGVVPFLMEEYLAGPEVSVETLSFDGRHAVVAVTAKQTGPGFVEAGHVVPASLPAEQDEQVRRLACRVLEAVGLREGPAHTEIVLTSEGPRVVESHNRRGGGRILDLVAAVYGVDIDAAAFGWYAGRPMLTAPRPPAGAAAVRFLSARPGVVEEVRGLEQARAHPATLAVEIGVRPGDIVRQLMWSFDRPGLVIARGANAVQAAANAASIASAITIVTRPVELPPRRIDLVGPHVGAVLGGG